MILIQLIHFWLQISGVEYGKLLVHTFLIPRVTIKQQCSLQKNSIAGVTLTTVLSKECPGYQVLASVLPKAAQNGGGELSQVSSSRNGH